LSTLTDTAQPFSADLVLEPADNQRLANLCGPLDEHLRQVERRMGVEINNRGNTFQVIGTEKSVEITERLIRDLYATTKTEVIVS
jgi:Phosphate starvation-inducible protein PhoH, predicted ATPase